MGVRNFLENMSNYTDFALENPHMRRLATLNKDGYLHNLMEDEAAQIEAAREAYFNQIKAAQEAEKNEAEVNKLNAEVEQILRGPAPTGMMQEVAWIADQYPNESTEQHVRRWQAMKGKGDTTDYITHYNHFLGLGKTPAEADRLAKELKAMGQSQSNAYGDRVDAQLLESLSKEVDAASSVSKSTKGYLNAMNTIAKNAIGIGPDGPLRPIYKNIAGYLGYFNSDLAEDATQLQLVDSLINQVINMRQKGGGSMSDSDFQAYLKLLGGLGSTDEQLALLAAYYEYEDDYANQRSKFFSGSLEGARKDRNKLKAVGTVEDEWRSHWATEQQGKPDRQSWIEKRAAEIYKENLKKNNFEDYKDIFQAGLPAFNFKDSSSIDKFIAGVRAGSLKPAADGLIHFYDESTNKETKIHPSVIESLDNST